MPYAIYLRKSRADMEAEARGEGETLARHQAQLTALAERYGLEVGAVYRELVSGETIAARPVMRRLIREVSEGAWEGVLCMEVERLARGDTMDQGLVSQAFKFSGTKIITPAKVYDPENEFDEEYFEFSLFMSRREYKTIRRRMQAGRMASVREGNYIGSRPPYGYRKVRGCDGKNFSLEPVPEEADAVRLIFELYTQKNMGCGKIAAYLDKLGIPPKRADRWNPSAVRGIIENPVYIGKLRWNRRKTVKKLADGKITVSRPSSEGQLFQGRHPPIIDEEIFLLAQTIREGKAHSSDHTQKPLQNQFAGLLYCGLCGRAMTRRPYKDKPAHFVCVHSGCGCMSSRESEITEAVIAVTKKLYGCCEVKVGGGDLPPESQVKKIAAAELEKLKRQRDKLFDLLEREVYSDEIFSARYGEISRRIKDTEKIIFAEEDNAPENHVPECISLENIMENLEIIPDAAVKNKLLKMLVKKINYFKTTGGRYGVSDLTLEIEFLF